MHDEHLLNLRLFPVIIATVLVEIHSLQQEPSLSLSLWLSSVLESEGPLWKRQSCLSCAWNPGEIVPHFLWYKAANASMWYFPPANRVCSHSFVSDSVTPWTVAQQAPLSVGFSRQEYWSGLLFPSPGHLPNPGIKPRSLTSSALGDRFLTTAPTGKPTVAIKFLYSDPPLTVFTCCAAWERHFPLTFF